MRTRAVVYALVAAVFLVSTGTAQRTEGAAKEVLWLEMVALIVGGTPTDHIVKEISERGLGFRPIAYQLEPLRNLGASEEVIRALQAARVVNEFEPDPIALASAARKAESTLREALNSQRSSAALHYALASSLLDDPKGAARELREAIRLNPNDPYAHYDLALLQSDRATNKAAIPELRTALRLKPDFGEAHNELAAILGWTHDSEGEITERRQAVRSDPSNPDFHFSLGECLRFKGDLDEALSEYLAAHRLNPEEESYLIRARVIASDYEKRGDLDRAIGAYRRLSEYLPRHAPTQYALGLILFKKGDNQSALEAIGTAQVLDPGNAVYYYAMGLILSKKGDKQAALEAIGKAQKLDPKNVVYETKYQEVATAPVPTDSWFGTAENILISEGPFDRDGKKDYLWVGFNSATIRQSLSGLARDGGWILGKVVVASEAPLGFYFDPKTTDVAWITTEACQTTIDAIKATPQAFASGPVTQWCIPVPRGTVAPQ